MSETALRDGPTPEFEQHHEVVHRQNGAGGKRVRSKLEALLEDGKISPEECDGGRRFINDYLAGVVGRSRSCLDISVRSSNGDGTESRHDAALRFEAARAAIDGIKSAQVRGARPSEVLLDACVEDNSYAAIGRTLGIDGEAAKVRIAVYLCALALHYAAADRRAGRSETPHTKEMALRRFQPKEDPEDQSS